MPRLATVAQDVRALGASAPLRAVYEGSKRSGFHSVLFRQVRDKGLRSKPVGLAPIVPKSEAARKRCLEDAGLILSEGTRVFGNRVPTGVHAPWNLDPLTGLEWPADAKWWTIDIRTGGRLSDVKWVWEAARHRDIVVLARAAVLEPTGPWLGELEAMLGSWLDQCRPERGVNWYSSLELALRAIAWAQMLELVGDRLAPELRAGVDAQLVASARHIMLELPYTVSSMKNNHLLGDGLGLVVLGRLFPEHPGAGRWRWLGDVLFHKQLERHMRADGSMIEDSLSYHRFVTEMLFVRVLLGDASQATKHALDGAGQHLRNLGVLTGDVPQYGDWDEGRVLADSQPAGSVAGSTWAALALSGYAIPEHAADDHDEVAWYVAPRGPVTTQPLAKLPHVRRSGHFTVAEFGDLHIWVKVGTTPSHQHADVGSVWIRRGDTWLIRDPGTGSYNGPLYVRNGFRTSAAHPVWRPGDADQLVPHRAFRWLRQVNASHALKDSGNSAQILSVHDAYVSEPENARVARYVEVTGEQVLVVDFIENGGYRSWRMTVPLGPSASALDGLNGTTHVGEYDPFLGWFSPTYGDWQPSPWTTVALSGRVAAWGVNIGNTEVDGDTVRANRATYSVRWATTSVTVVRKQADGTTTILTARDD